MGAGPGADPGDGTGRDSRWEGDLRSALRRDRPVRAAPYLLAGRRRRRGERGVPHRVAAAGRRTGRRRGSPLALRRRAAGPRQPPPRFFPAGAPGRGPAGVARRRGGGPAARERRGSRRLRGAVRGRPRAAHPDRAGGPVPGRDRGGARVLAFRSRTCTAHRARRRLGGDWRVLRRAGKGPVRGPGANQTQLKAQTPGR